MSKLIGIVPKLAPVDVQAPGKSDGAFLFRNTDDGDLFYLKFSDDTIALLSTATIEQITDIGDPNFYFLAIIYRLSITLDADTSLLNREETQLNTQALINELIDLITGEADGLILNKEVTQLLILSALTEANGTNDLLNQIIGFLSDGFGAGLNLEETQQSVLTSTNAITTAIEALGANASLSDILICLQNTISNGSSLRDIYNKLDKTNPAENTVMLVFERSNVSPSVAMATAVADRNSAIQGLDPGQYIVSETSSITQTLGGLGYYAYITVTLKGDI